MALQLPRRAPSRRKPRKTNLKSEKERANDEYGETQKLRGGPTIECLYSFGIDGGHQWETVDNDKKAK